jgi:hypothetical protein
VWSVGNPSHRRLGKGEADCKEPFVARCRLCRWDHMGSSLMLQLVFFFRCLFYAIDRSDRCAIFPAEVLGSPFVEIDLTS